MRMAAKLAAYMATEACKIDSVTNPVPSHRATKYKTLGIESAIAIVSKLAAHLRASEVVSRIRFRRPIPTSQIFAMIRRTKMARIDPSNINPLPGLLFHFCLSEYPKSSLRRGSSRELTPARNFRTSAIAIGSVLRIQVTLRSMS